MLTQSPRILKLTIVLFVLGVLATNYLLYLIYRGNTNNLSIETITIKNKHHSSNWQKILEKKGTSALNNSKYTGCSVHNSIGITSKDWHHYAFRLLLGTPLVRDRRPRKILVVMDCLNRPFYNALEANLKFSQLFCSTL